MLETPPQRKSVIVAVIAALILLFPLAYSVVSYLSPKEAEAAFLERPGPEHERCVRETVYMRFHHWELLKQIRDEVVRHGKRNEIRFTGCGDCHANRERFCNQCHNAVNLSPDCFDCHHYPAPGETKTATAQSDETTSSTATRTDF